MAKKTLNEATIRRFQKLAKVAPLTETYEGMHAKDEDMHKEEMHEEMHEEEEVAAAADDMDDMDDADAGQDVELTDEEARLLIDLGEKLAEAMGEEDAEEEEETDLAVADDAAVELGDEMAADAEADEMMEALAGISYIPSQSEIVNEVAQRVARRLQAAKLHEAKLNKALGRK